MQVSSLGPYLRDSLRQNCRMDAALMRPEEAARCRWVGFGVGKGVTDLSSDTSVFAVLNRLQSGMHGELIQGFPGVDSLDLCYEDAHVRGFGNFIRWVYFADPAGGPGFFGVDWSMRARLTAGVATTMINVCVLARRVLKHGIPADAELVLLNARMCERQYMQQFREDLDLIRANQWAETTLFTHDVSRCPKCGLDSLQETDEFCGLCGANPHELRSLAMMHPTPEFEGSAPPPHEQRYLPPSQHTSQPGATVANFCSGCGQKFQPDDSFCPKCGQPRKNV